MQLDFDFLLAEHPIPRKWQTSQIGRDHSAWRNREEEPERAEGAP